MQAKIPGVPITFGGAPASAPAPRGGGGGAPRGGPAPRAKIPGVPITFGGGPVPRPRPKVRNRKPKPKVKARTAGLMPCVAVAVARVLGLRADQVLPYCQPGGDLISDVLEALAADGLAGEFWAAEPDEGLPGMVIGLTMPEGMHAAVTMGDGLMWSWGLAMPLRGSVDEAWWALPASLEEDVMQSQKSDPLAFGRVYGRVMADRQAGVPPVSHKPLAVQLGLVPDQEDGEGLARILTNEDEADA